VLADSVLCRATKLSVQGEVVNRTQKGVKGLILDRSHRSNVVGSGEGLLLGWSKLSVSNFSLREWGLLSFFQGLQ